MQRIYLDNAATTPLDPQVLEAMMPFLTDHFGNASAIYSFGREVKIAIEKSRKFVASSFNVTPSEIFFTSCGTESSNTAIHGAVRDLGCTHIISSPIEHHATLNTIKSLASQQACKVTMLQLTENGHVDLNDLEQILQNAQEKCLVTLMHANNEIGNLLNLEQVSHLCKKHNAILHSDMVQTVAHYQFDLQKLPIHFLSASAHKFHGPKGSGLLYINNEVQIKPFINGGGQERQMRAGTENVANIVGFAKALELALATLNEDATYTLQLKKHLHQLLSDSIPEIQFNGDVFEQSLYTVLSASFPVNEKTEMLSINLDMAGICVSGGSACNSGAQGGSHVIKQLYPNENRVPIRFSFSKHTKMEHLEIVVQKIKELLNH